MPGYLPPSRGHAHQWRMERRQLFGRDSLAPLMKLLPLHPHAPPHLTLLRVTPPKATPPTPLITWTMLHPMKTMLIPMLLLQWLIPVILFHSSLMLKWRRGIQLARTLLAPPTPLPLTLLPSLLLHYHLRRPHPFPRPLTMMVPTVVMKLNKRVYPKPLL